MRLTMCLLLLAFVSSCSDKESALEVLRFSRTDFPQTWELSSINAGLSGEIVQAEEIPVQEIYTLKENGIFSKEFRDEYAQGNISGSFEVVSIDTRTYVAFTYEAAMDSLSYCSRNNSENMLVSEDGQVLSNGSCLAFDGPSMNYVRIE